MSEIRKVYMHDGLGNPISSYLNPSNGEYVINVHDADVHIAPVNNYFFRETGTTDPLTVAATAGDTSITVTDGTKFAVLDEIQISNGTEEPVFSQVTAIATNTLTLNRPIDSGYDIGDTVSIVSTNMAVNGTLASPVSFKIRPVPGVTWHIVRFLFSMTHSSAGDLGLFGNLSTLTNGVVIRAYNGAADIYRTFTLWQSNSDIKDNMYDVNFDTRSGGGGTFGTTGRGSIKLGTGAVPRVSGTNGDFIEILIQDDLTGLTTFKQKAQGHIEGG